MILRVLWWCFRTASNMALKIDISQVAVAMHALAEAVREVHVRLSIDDMLHLSQAAAAGRTGSSVVPHFISADFLADVQACQAACYLKASS